MNGWGPCWRLEVTCGGELARVAAERLRDFGWVVALCPRASCHGESGWRLTAHIGVDGPVDRAAMVADLERAAVAMGEAVPAVSLSLLPATDWLAANRRDFAPLVIGRLLVHDGPLAVPPPQHMWPLRIDAATAFGTGRHPTTRLCLDLIEKQARRRRPGGPVPGMVLDMGCGSGILAIAAALRLRRPVIALDTDPESVRVARVNARLNRVAGLVRTDRVDPLAKSLAGGRFGRGFDLVMANILRDPLIAMAPSLSRALAPGGRLVLTGLLAHQAVAVRQAFAAHRLRLENRLTAGEWVALVMRRRPAGLPGLGLQRQSLA